MHVTDLLPTFAAAGSIDVNDSSLDGFNQWETISLGTKSPRKEMQYNIENILGYSAVMHEGWKIVNGSENIEYANWFGNSGLENVNISFKSYVQDILDSEVSKYMPTLNAELIKDLRDQATVKCSYNNTDRQTVDCDPQAAPCLFNVFEDPCEQNNLADSFRSKTEFLLSIMNRHIKDTIPTRRRFIDSNCNPKNFNYTWTWWQDNSIDIKDSGEWSLQRKLFYSICVVVLASVSCLLINKCNRKQQRF